MPLVGEPRRNDPSPLFLKGEGCEAPSIIFPHERDPEFRSHKQPPRTYENHPRQGILREVVPPAPPPEHPSPEDDKRKVEAPTMGKVEYKPNPTLWVANRYGKRPPAAKRTATGKVFRSPAGDPTTGGQGYVSIPNSGRLKWATRTARSAPNAQREGKPENLPAFLTAQNHTPEHLQAGTGPTRSAPYTGTPEDPFSLSHRLASSAKSARTGPKEPTIPVTPKKPKLARSNKRPRKITPAPGSKLNAKTRKVESTK